MAARRLVLNGLTAEVGPGAPPPAAGAAGSPGSPDSLEFYHELELYRQLLALPPPHGRRARTPDPPPASREHEEPPRRSRTPGARASAPPPPAAVAVAVARPAKYLGSFPVGGGEHAARVDTVTTHLHLMKENGRAVPVLVVIALTGLRVCNPDDQSVRMSHALRRISYATCESSRALFAYVAREPRTEPANHYCYAFETDTPDQAEELNTLVGDAFRMAFASQLQPSAPLWSKELSGECGGMGVRAPDSLPGLTHHYPPRSPAKCDIMGVTKLVNEVSPSSSEESNSPTEINCYRRLGDRPPLMKRIAMGFSGALLQPSDDDSTPLVTDTPTTPTNLPLCLNGGYINEASEAEARTRESNREVPAPPRRTETLQGDLDVDFRRCTNIKNSSPVGACSRTTSSSSGASSCGGSHASGNNNAPRAEPELRQAPWFQQGIPREIALEVLSSQAVGAFLVRGSTTQAGCFALSVRVPRDFQPSGIAHYLILRTPKGYKIKGFTKEFTSLSALVTHHSVMPELLPVPLRLPRAPARAPPARRDHADIDTVAHHARHPHARAHHHLQNFLAQLDV
ncbi:uncharacterized protein LOC113515587 isoform X2 [Galleria mellonella]|uniref:Uncharacterized protein LOC113515587 isoform X2 n=1 Tax=Galleria mellonella TaxID=7137 RepID=A0ABM3MQ43_GALME|nr:uncharacterized protein LOC113515587 isoform X2 [Galleria mellonella]